MLVRRPDIGQRHQIACALRAVSRMRPPRGAAVVLLDGAALLPPGSLARTLPFLKLMPEVDAITADQRDIVAGGPVAQVRHRLRDARRHQLMSSMALWRRRPVIAGMSIHRVEVATDPSFFQLRRAR